MLDESGSTPSGDIEEPRARERGSRGRRTGALLAALPLGAVGMTALGSATAGASTSGSGSLATTATTSGSSAPQLPPPPGPGATAQDWLNWSAAQKAAIEGIDWQGGLSSLGCDVASVSFPAAPVEPGSGAPAGLTTTGVDVVARCPAGISPLSLLGAPARGPQPHIVSGNTCGSVTDGEQCVQSFDNGGTYIQSGYSNDTTNTIDGYEELSAEGASASSCAVGTQVARNPSSGYMGLNSGFTAYATYGPISADNVWDGTWWKGTGSYTDTGDVCTYI